VTPAVGGRHEEIGRLREQLAALQAQAEANHRILRRYRARELALLQADDLPSLFRRMVVDLRRGYRLSAVTLILPDPEREIRHLLASLATAEEPRYVVFLDSASEAPAVLRGLRAPWLGRFRPLEHAPLFGDRGTALGSVALVPLQLEHRVLGWLNLGSDDPERFTPRHAADFLAHMGVIAAYCIENTVNRALLQRRGFVDVLTGWHNRRYLESRLLEELNRARREQGALACLMLDVDHFKQINDRHGHLVGDRVLYELAQRIGAEVRSSDVAARYGGEEFALLLPGAGTEEARQLAERVRLSVASRPIVLQCHSLDVTVSAGVASISPQPDEGDLPALRNRLLSAADRALYRAKNAGRNCVAVGET
jgi:two-component system, cell cycle response regulator